MVRTKSSTDLTHASHFLFTPRSFCTSARFKNVVICVCVCVCVCVRVCAYAVVVIILKLGTLDRATYIAYVVTQWWYVALLSDIVRVDTVSV